MAILDASILAMSGRWPESVARKAGPAGPPSFATCALLPASGPTLGTSALGAPWANVGALAALVGEAARSRDHQAIKSRLAVAAEDCGTRSRSPRSPSAARSGARRDARSWSASARTRTRCEARR